VRPKVGARVVIGLVVASVRFRGEPSRPAPVPAGPRVTWSLPVTMSLPARGRLSSGNGRPHVMGRVTYLEMAEFWPKSSHRKAAPMNDIPKVVFSRRLRDASWPETRIARGDTALEIGRLKVEPGGEIIAHGGTQFVRSLVRLGLVDRYRFYEVPFAAGAGVPLFTADAHPGRVRLEQSTAYPGGILELVYAPA
jgi:dihydrofolate reductase